MTLDINKKPARYAKKAWAAFVKRPDRATPSQRKLLDRLEAVRPDMAPLKLFYPSPRGELRVVGGLFKPNGVYSIMWATIRRMVREGGGNMSDDEFAADITRELANDPTPGIIWKRRPEVLLHPNIPKPMHGLAPRVILGTAWWDRVRRDAYASTGHHCTACGVYRYEAEVKTNLEAHELYVIDYPRGRMAYVETVPLCYFCHSFIHDGRAEMLRRTGTMPTELYERIMKHGQRVLRAAKLKTPRAYAGPIAEWSAWRLVVDGREYPPRLASYEDWYRYYQSGKPNEEV